MSLLKRKLGRMEQALKPARRKWFLWREEGESGQEVIKRHMAGHPEAQKTDLFHVISWQDDEPGDLADQGDTGQRL